MPHVRIYQPARTATQSGRAKCQAWTLEYELETPRRPEPLMGWTASADTLNQVRLSFESRDRAVAFAEEQGWSYEVLPVRERRISPKNYLDNFRS